MEIQPKLYNTTETDLLVKHLTSGILDPEYILLFGSLAGGTPHSDTTAYDLLVAVRDKPDYSWMQVNRYLRYKVPVRYRQITYINLYILPLSYINFHKTPFLYFSHTEGDLLFCADNYHFKPKRICDFAAAYCDAKYHYDTFSALADQFIERAQAESGYCGNLRMSAVCIAQAAVYLYHTLYYVYHGMEFDSYDPVLMHGRMRTLSAKLMVILDDTHIERAMTLPGLKDYMNKARYDCEFAIDQKELGALLDRIVDINGIIQNACELRLELYKARE